LEIENKRILVTSALPYANGPLHIGHLAGCYLPADIYVRYQRAKGRDVIHICGTDEHGVQITLKAEEEGISPKELVDRYYRIISKALTDLGIYYDNFSISLILAKFSTVTSFLCFPSFSICLSIIASSILLNNIFTLLILCPSAILTDEA